MKTMLIKVLLCGLPISLWAQATHVIEPAILEVKYKVVYGKDKDEYALRCGKHTSQYINIDTYVSDSMSNSPNGPDYDMERLRRMMDALEHRDDDSKRMPYSPGRGQYLYRNLTQGKITVYASLFGDYCFYEEPIPQMDWHLVADSTRTIVGQQCLMAKTRFRGREWTVWYAPEVGIPLGPWKLAGLPGLILKAHCENYIDLEANSLQTKGVPPVMFYNFYNHKYTLIAREKYLKASTDPKTYPPKTIIAPPMELE